MGAPTPAAKHTLSARSAVTPGNLATILELPPLETGTTHSAYPRAQPPHGLTTNSSVPVFRDGRFSGFIERSPVTHAVTCSDQGDAELQRRLTEVVSTQDWLDPDHVGIAVENRVVHLIGRGDSMHAVLVLRRLAAAAPCVAAVIDDLWVDNE